jgi:hypothetical protein
MSAQQLRSIKACNTLPGNGEGADTVIKEDGDRQHTDWGWGKT